MDLLGDKIGLHFIMILQFLFLSKFTKKLIIICTCNDKLVLLIFSKVNKSNTFWHVCFLKKKIICSDNILQLEPTMLCSVCMTEQRNCYPDNFFVRSLFTASAKYIKFAYFCILYGIFTLRPVVLTKNKQKIKL